MSEVLRVRFAPSPTGYLHLGGARTALFNFLFARHNNGKFILRIEDTDRSRYVENSLQEIYESLKWLGINWDEGPYVGGEYGPYIQSERLELYKKCAQQLIDKNVAYRCFCTPQRLEEVRKIREKEKMLTSYDRKCRNLSNDEIKRNLEKNIPYVIRLKIPDNRVVSFYDMIRGNIEYRTEVLDDLVLLKSDGYPTYHLANVVDDHEMAITHVLRGDEWIASTPRHILLYEAFEWKAPKFAHLPVILDPSGGKLSKRKGAASVMDYKKIGILPEALFNFLALLGWSPGGEEKEKMTKEEIISLFSLDKVSPKGSIFDEKKLFWMNGLYLLEVESKKIYKEVYNFLLSKEIIKKEDKIEETYIIKVIDLLKSRSKTLSELTQNSFYFFKDPSNYEEKAAKKYFSNKTSTLLSEILKEIYILTDFSKEKIELLYKNFCESKRIQLSEIVHPTRLALSGVSFGPGLFELMEILGKETIIRRLQKAIEYIENSRKINNLES
jgi:glutamyl-tRNA synthetase